MNALRTWLFGVLAASLLLSLVQPLFPKGKYRAIGALVGGLLLLLVMLRPLLTADWDSLFRYRLEIETQTQHRWDAQQEELEAVISEKTASYIQAMSASHGLTCQAQVRCTQRGGVPFPTEVWLDISYDAALSQAITEQLDIPQAYQHWQEDTP